MSNLSIDQKKILDLLGDGKAEFIIPSYQRQYAWEEHECSRLWDDFCSFVFPEGDSGQFERNNDEYFLGSIVTFSSDNKKHEVIDGHQRLVTLILLLRAFYEYCSQKDTKLSITARKGIEKCLGYINEADEPDKNSCKIEIKVITDDTLQEFQEILRTGKAPKTQKSRYAENYRFFLQKIEDLMFIDVKGDFSLMPIRIMNNCILLPIEADSQETALQIFSTLNDRGKPLSDSDIFKAQLYEYYDKHVPSRKDEFIIRWQNFEEICDEIFSEKNADEAFKRYMYYECAKQGNKKSTMEAMRKFYEKNYYALLKKDETFKNIIDLANFWKSVSIQDKRRFSDRVLKRLFVLKHAPDYAWTNITSVYYLKNRNENGTLDDRRFYDFLSKITAFTLGYLVIGKNSQAFPSPLYAEILNIVNGNEVKFEKYKFDSTLLLNAFRNYEFKETNKSTRFMLIWWAFQDQEQILLDIAQKFEFSSICPKTSLERYEAKGYKIFHALGNKSVKILPSRMSKEREKLRDLYTVSFANFTKNDVVKRDEGMLEELIEYLKKNDLIK